MLEIKNRDLNLNDTITCGQLFRYFEKDDNSYDIVLKDRVINVKMDNDTLLVKSNNEDGLKEIVYNYFDLNTDYKKISDEIIKMDKKLTCDAKNSVGLKMLRQDPTEMIISYIISANNKVSRIANSINLLCSKYGDEIVFNEEKYYLFPSIDKLSKLSVADFNELKIGFRDKYVFDAVKKINDKEIDIDKIYELNSDDALNYLMQINGVGPKVASCILLFGYNRFDVFPVDTWVMKQICKLHQDVKPTQKAVIEFAKNKYKNLSGIALQYMFHNSRNKKN